MVWELVRSKNDARLLLQSYVLGCLVSLVSLTFVFVTRGSFDYLEVERMSGGGMNANDLALVLAIGIPVAFFLAATPAEGSKFGQWLNTGFAILAAVGLMLTGSRGAFVSLSAGIIFFVLLVPGQRMKRRLVSVGVLAGIMLVVFYAMPSNMRLRYSEIPEEIAHGTMAHRKIVWEAGLRVSKEHPWAGVGTGTFSTAISPYLSRPGSAHNAYLGILVETGVIGFLIFLGLFVIVGKNVLKSPPRIRPIWGAVLVILIVGISALSWQYRKPTWLFLGVLANRYVVGVGVRDKGRRNRMKRMWSVERASTGHRAP